MMKSSSKKSLPKSKGQSPSKGRIEKQPSTRFKSQKTSWNGELAKRRIEDIKVSQMVIRVTYGDKRINVPVTNLGDQSLDDILRPHVSRFEIQVLGNRQFNSNFISCWKTVNGDYSKDYFLQAARNLEPFRGQLLHVEPVWKAPSDAQITISDYEIVKCIGSGGFSNVFLARFVRDGHFYALKLMDKQELINSKRECVITNERDMLVHLNNPFIVKMESAFESSHFAVIVLEYCPGGELFNYLKSNRSISESTARFCFIEVALALQHLHGRRIIYRDIKPQNIMIDANGHLKLADFGLSRFISPENQPAYSFCGSPEYMAPEMLDKSGHGFELDYYCLGALLYEIVVGVPPYYSNNVDQIYEGIRRGELTFPSNFDISNELIDLLQRLLKKTPSKRLGSLGGFREIFAHPWIKKVKVTDYINRLIPSPLSVDLLKSNVNDEDCNTKQVQSFLLHLKTERKDFKPFLRNFYYNASNDRSAFQSQRNILSAPSTPMITGKGSFSAPKSLNLSAHVNRMKSAKNLQLRNCLSRDELPKYNLSGRLGATFHHNAQSARVGRRQTQRNLMDIMPSRKRREVHNDNIVKVTKVYGKGSSLHKMTRRQASCQFKKML